MNNRPDPDDSLPRWDEIRNERDWSSLLVGNGFSQNVWARYGYPSLFETARTADIEHTLSADDVALFERLGTRNFELVLSALSTSIAVAEALQRDAAHLRDRYDSIRRALVGAVHHVHLPWASFPDGPMRRAGEELTAYEFVYSTNYDLLVYWCLMVSAAHSKDYFFTGPTFDITDTVVWGKCTKALYLHGGLHLYRRPNGQTLKRAATEDQNLLDLFGTDYQGAVPLFISEGDPDQKKASIYRSEYLAFAFAQFADDRGPLVVFGHSLSPSDQHLVDALKRHAGQSVAISIRRDGGNIRERKLQLMAALPDADLLFFDAQTHPLGSDDLRVQEDV